MSDTGGKGQWNGGDGIIRELLFRKCLTLSILTERRVFEPYGLKGSIKNWYYYADAMAFPQLIV